MHGPLALVQVVPGAPAGGDIVATHPEHHATGGLQVIQNAPAVRAEEFVTVDLSVHGAWLDVGQAGAVGANDPGAVHKLPGPLVTEEHLLRIGGGELHVIEPGMAFVEFVDVACP